MTDQQFCDDGGFVIDVDDTFAWLGAGMITVAAALAVGAAGGLFLLAWAVFAR